MIRYLDTSVIVPLFVNEANTGTTRGWILDGNHELVVADLVVTEFHAAMSRLVRMNIVTNDQAETIRQQFDLWRDAAAEPLENLPIDLRSAGVLVRSPTPKLLSADAIHLATCRRLGLALVTYDIDLQAVAGREGVAWECPV